MYLYFSCLGCLCHNGFMSHVVLFSLTNVNLSNFTESNFSLIILSYAYFGLSFSLNYLTFLGFQTYYYVDVNGHLSKVNLFHTTPLEFTPTAFETPHVPPCLLSCDFSQYQGYSNYRDFCNHGQLF